MTRGGHAKVWITRSSNHIGRDGRRNQESSRNRGTWPEAARVAPRSYSPTRSVMLKRREKTIARSGCEWEVLDSRLLLRIDRQYAARWHFVPGRGIGVEGFGRDHRAPFEPARVERLGSAGHPPRGSRARSLGRCERRRGVAGRRCGPLPSPSVSPPRLPRSPAWGRGRARVRWQQGTGPGCRSCRVGEGSDRLGSARRSGGGSSGICRSARYAWTDGGRSRRDGSSIVTFPNVAERTCAMNSRARLWPQSETRFVSDQAGSVPR